MLLKEPCIPAKKAYVLSKEPYLQFKEPCIRSPWVRHHRDWHHARDCLWKELYTQSKQKSKRARFLNKTAQHSVKRALYLVKKIYIFCHLGRDTAVIGIVRGIVYEKSCVHCQKSPLIVKRALFSIKRAQHSIKRALHPVRIALYSIKRALYPVPIFIHLWWDTTMIGIVREIHHEKSSIHCQKSPTFIKRALYSVLESFTFGETPPWLASCWEIHHEKSSIYCPKSTTFIEEPYIQS